MMLIKIIHHNPLFGIFEAVGLAFLRIGKKRGASFDLSARRRFIVRGELIVCAGHSREHYA
jgi:hypothetical protein